MVLGTLLHLSLLEFRNSWDLGYAVANAQSQVSRSELASTAAWLQGSKAPSSGPTFRSPAQLKGLGMGLP